MKANRNCQGKKQLRKHNKKGLFCDVFIPSFFAAAFTEISSLIFRVELFILPMIQETVLTIRLVDDQYIVGRDSSQVPTRGFFGVCTLSPKHGGLNLGSENG